MKTSKLKCNSSRNVKKVPEKKNFKGTKKQTCNRKQIFQGYTKQFRNYFAHSGISLINYIFNVSLRSLQYITILCAVMAESYEKNVLDCNTSLRSDQSVLISC